MKGKAVELPEEISPEWVSREHDRLLRDAGNGELRLDCSRLRKVDSLSLAWLARLHGAMQGGGKRLVLTRVPPGLKDDFSRATTQDSVRPETRDRMSLTEQAGDGTLRLYRELRGTLLLLSESLYWSTFASFRRKTLYPGETITQMVRLGSAALPIVVLLSGLIGFTLALQSGEQLQKFGATIFLASGIGISMVTEIGPVMTAVIVAGRSGSAVTAEIATMVVQEEVGALHAMAINPIHFLVLPRFWAMSLAMPLLTFCSALSGIVAGLVVGTFFFKLSPASYLHELQVAVTLGFLWQAFVKSVTFSWIIGLVAINKGLNVRGGADAVGRATTSCVVTCISTIIIADAVFSFIFYF